MGSLEPLSGTLLRALPPRGLPHRLPVMGAQQASRCLVTGHSHPLLWNGRTRVYAETYLCHKCELRFPSILSLFQLIDTDSRRQRHGLQGL